MKKILFILSIFILLVACAQTETIKTTTTAGIPTTPQASTATSSLDQVKTDTLAKNDITQNLVIPININKGKAGDTFTIGAVFNLVNIQPIPLVVKLDFADARDTSYNKIEITRDAANAWVQSMSEFTPVEGAPYYIPITVKTPSTAAPGTYMYDVLIYKIENGFQNKIDGITKKVNIKIE